ncbi:protein-tyrosine phosphatase [Niveomyces insectorum RCEF 264]|uniref:protein-tyrosine-phosphatase n=1 Tax=Niveomyces insectorum RCEF 264 TaxID=1081102 RepID=A0A168AAJ8_9HYPO|nr:protein-tyrosine phosphatase [Niveomyces insectorum RCEF 264]
MAPSTKAPNLGQIIEYLPDRLYLASYLNPPDAETLFPFGDQPPKSPSKKSQRTAAGSSDSTSSSSSTKYAGREPYYFTVDKSLLYNAFHHDFGPLHVGHLYRFALQFHEVLAATELQQRPVVFWSQADPRSRANASCLLACYMVLIQSWPPHLALAPIAQVDPPLMPFRDAGYSQADYGITVQDVVYGVWKAKEEGCCVLDNFDLAEYENFERVENGDFNWITSNFLAFASPQHSPVSRITEGDAELYASLPRTLDAVDAHPALPQPFKNVLRYFSERNIGLVVRLNSPLYSPSYFEALGIQHLDMIFEDGTCPPMSTVRKFVRLAREMITVRKKSIAVHCKAGLGRTGCLIGAYLIYRHGFTANEVISFMRFMRPGMVVGPQQHWLHLNQGIFREWWVEERLERKLRREFAATTAAAAASAASVAAAAAASNNLPSTPIRAMQKANLGRSSNQAYSTSTPPHRSASGRTPLSEMDQERTNVAQDDYLPAPTPGQPRKGTRADRHHPYARSKTAGGFATVEDEGKNATTSTTIEEEAELYTVLQDKESGSDGNRSSRGADSEEEMYLRMRMHRKANAAATSSPAHATRRHNHKSRSASHTSHNHNTVTATSATTTTTSTTTNTNTIIMDNDASFDAENIGSSISRVKSMHHNEHEGGSGRDQRVSSASGVLTKVRSSDRAAAHGGGASSKRLAGAQPTGVRKTSGRVGSAGNMPSAAAMSSAARKISSIQ